MLAVMRSKQFRADEGFRKKIAALADVALPEISDAQTRDEIQILQRVNQATTANDLHSD